MQLGPRGQPAEPACRNSLAPAGLLAGKGVTEEGVLTTSRFVAGEGVEAAPASLPSSVEWRRPLWFGCRRGDRRGSPTNEC
jgi:hypothetical protein